MGANCCSGQKQRAREVNQRIEDQMNAAAKKDATVFKILLFGAGESGKTTLFSQMRMNFGSKYTDEEKQVQRPNILVSLFEGFVELVNAAAEPSGLGSLEFDDFHGQLKTYLSFVKQHKTFTESSSDQLMIAPEEAKRIMRVLWSSEVIQAVWKKRSKYQIMDSLTYFMEDSTFERVMSPNYVPNTKDLLYSRVRTTGVTEQFFTYKRATFRVVDVGGQRNERRKWMEVLTDVTAVLFVIAISEFDQKLYEDAKVNRLEEAVGLLKSTMNFPVFNEHSFILFFNKMDLFEEKLKNMRAAGVDLDQYFPSLQLGTKWEYDEAKKLVQNEITERFIMLSRNNTKNKIKLFTHYVTATDTEIFKQVFDATAKVILAENINNHTKIQK